MRVAALDLGTNTFHLLIAEKKSDGGINFIFRKTCVVKLGREGFVDGMISDGAFQRGIDAMKQFAVPLRKFRPEKTIALATSGIRSCKNGAEFIHNAERIIKNKIQIISGDREAELIYRGVINSFPQTDEPVLIMDIGGGSVEFIIASHSKIFWKRSIEAGAARLLEKFSPSNPVTAAEILRMNDYLRKVFHPVLKAVKKYKPEILIGSSGSFDSFALMSGIKSAKPLMEIPLTKYFKLHKTLIHSTKKERLSMKGLHRMRIDMIVPASICANFILREAGIKKLFRSAYALREGIIFSELA
jgi:exopolyphosphatase / guanosine-5'-triphosphate,3'-diphosphate pyrophosphatase